VLEGRVDVQVGDEVVHGTPGSFVLIPRGTFHTFWNAGSGPAKILIIISPPGIGEYLAEVIGDQDIDAPTFIERVTAVAEKYRVTVVGPPRG
jgi:mannose-6-phosphate isomerase-like protein (cupin superfamily)